MYTSNFTKSSLSSSIPFISNTSSSSSFSFLLLDFFGLGTSSLITELRGFGKPPLLLIVVFGSSAAFATPDLELLVVVFALGCVLFFSYGIGISWYLYLSLRWSGQSRTLTRTSWAFSSQARWRHHTWLHPVPGWEPRRLMAQWREAASGTIQPSYAKKHIPPI